MTRLARLWAIVAVPLVVFGLSKVHAAYIADPPYDFTGSARFTWASTYVVFLWIASFALGLPGLVPSIRSALWSAFAAVALAATAISLAQLGLGDALLPRFVVFGSAGLLVPLLALGGLLYGTGHRRAAQRDRVFFVGVDHEGVRLEHEMAGQTERPAVLVGRGEVGELIAEPGTAPLLEALVEAKASLIVLDVGAQAEPSVVAQAAHAHERGVRVRTLSLFYEEWLGKLPLSELERVSLFFDVGEIHRARYAQVKRLLDVGIGLIGVVVLAVVAPVIWVANQLGNRGPLFFRQERVGKGGRRFTILKFRTMRPGSSDGSWTTEDDPRVTRFGGVLRRSHIDELPQLLNILRGDLSLIGPRPEQARYVEELDEKLPFYGLRHLVRPGLTGWAQVKYGYAADERDALEKLQYEFFYLRRQSLSFDARIVARTLRHLGSGGGR